MEMTAGWPLIMGYSKSSPVCRFKFSQGLQGLLSKAPRSESEHSPQKSVPLLTMCRSFKNDPVNW